MISITSGFRKNVADQPAKTAITTAKSAITYAELDEWARAIAQHIRETVEPGELVGSIAGNSAHAIAVILGARFARRELVLLDWKMPDVEVTERCMRMGVRSVLIDDLVDENTASALESSGVRVSSAVTTALQASTVVADDMIDPVSWEEPIWHAPSGGSSGVRKAIALSESASLFRFASQTVEFGLDRSSSFLLSAPLIHGGGRSFSIGQLVGGGTVELHQKFDVDDVLDALLRVKGAFLVPTMLARLLRSPRWEDVAARSEATLVISGGRLDSDLGIEASRLWNGRLFNYFGSTEAGAVSVAEYRAGARNSSGDLGYYSVGCVGSLQRLPEGHRLSSESEDTGRLLVSNPGNCLWSLDIASNTKTRPLDGFWDHGDVVRVHADGSLEYAGRADDLIVTGGVNVYPAEVVELLERTPGVIAAAVVGHRDAEWGEIVGAAVEAGPEVTTESLKATLRKSAKPAFIPKSLTIVDSIPRNAMSKNDGNAVRSLVAETGPNWIDRRVATAPSRDTR